MSDPLVDRAIKKALERSSGPEGGCPDMNRVAAYLERKCGAAEQVQLEHHFAECNTCREVLAICLEPSETDPAISAGNQPSRSRAFLRFAVPLSAVALAAIVILTVVVVRRDTSSVPATEVAEVRPNAKAVETAPMPLPAPAAAARQESAAQKPERDASAVAKAKVLQEDKAKVAELQAQPVPAMQKAEAPDLASQTPPRPAQTAPGQDQYVVGMPDRIAAQSERLQAQQTRAPMTEQARIARMNTVRSFMVAGEVAPEEAIAGFSALAKPGGSEVRNAGEKTFYFWSGYWIDGLCASNRKAPLEQAPRGSKAYRELTGQLPWLADFASTPVMLYWNGKIFVIR